MQPAQVSSCPLLSVLIPDVSLTIEEGGLTGLNDDQLLAVARMLVKTAQQAISAFRSGNYPNLDALIGNFGCERHAFKMLQLPSSAELSREFQTLERILKAALEVLNGYNSDRKVHSYRTPKVSIQELFDSRIAPISLSEAMAFLFQARLLTVTKEALRNAEGYEAQEKTNISRIDQLAQGIPSVLRQRMVELAQQQMAKSANVFVAEQAQQLSSIGGAELALLRQMLDVPNVLAIGADGHRTRDFICCFYSVKAVLLLAQERKTLLAVKSMTRRGEKPLLLFYRAKGGGSFELLKAEEVAQLNEKEPLLLCEGFLAHGTTGEVLVSKLEQFGLYNVALAGAAQKSPYDSKSTLEDVLVQEAREEILSWREKALMYQKDPFFELDHVSLSRVGLERSLKR